MAVNVGSTFLVFLVFLVLRPAGKNATFLATRGSSPQHWTRWPMVLHGVTLFIRQSTTVSTALWIQGLPSACMKWHRYRRKSLYTIYMRQLVLAVLWIYGWFDHIIPHSMGWFEGIIMKRHTKSSWFYPQIDRGFNQLKLAQLIQFVEYHYLSGLTGLNSFFCLFLPVIPSQFSYIKVAVPLSCCDYAASTVSWRSFEAEPSPSIGTYQIHVNEWDIDAIHYNPHIYWTLLTYFRNI